MATTAGSGAIADNSMSGCFVSQLRTIFGVFTKHVDAAPFHATRHAGVPMPPTPYHIRQLCDFCRAYPVDEKVLFVPFPQIGYMLGTAVAATNTPWVNLRALTPLDHARSIAAPILIADGWRELGNDENAFLMTRLVEDLVSNSDTASDPGFFHDAPMTAGLVSAFATSIRDLRESGCDRRTIADVLAGTPKGAGVLKLFDAYDRALREEHLFDPAHLMRAAIDTVESGRTPRPRHVAVLDETPLTGLAARYVAALSDGAPLRIGRDHYGSTPPRRTAASRYADAPARVDPGEVAPGGRLFMRDALEPDGRIALRIAIGSENEVRGVLRQILASDTPLDDIEIAYTSGAPYLNLLIDLTERLGIPTTFAFGIPTGLTAAGQSLSGYLRWILRGLDATELIEMCRAGLISFVGVPHEGPALDPHRVADRLERARIGKGRARYVRSLEIMRADAKRRLEDGDDDDRERAEREVQFVEDLSTAVERLLLLAPSGRTMTNREAAASAVGFLTAFAPKRLPRDQAALRSLLLRLRAFDGAIEVQADSNRIVGSLAALLAGHTFDALLPRPSHLSVVPIGRSGYGGRSTTYVVGLDEASFPGIASEEPILLDDERAAISPELPLLRQTPGERVWEMVRALGAAAGTVTLSSNRLATLDGRVMFPSPLFQQAARRAEIAMEAIGLDGPVPMIDRAIDDIEYRLAAGPAAARDAIADERFGWLEQGRIAMEARAERGLTRFNGMLGVDHEELHPLAGEEPMSASKLETLAACPYRYFLNHVLGIRPPREPSDDPSVWLDALDVGTLLHAVFHRVMEAITERGERPDPTRHAALMQERIDAELDRQRSATPPPNAAAEASLRERLTRAGELFLSEESQRPFDVEPIAFELAFGMADEGGESQPIELELNGRVLRLRGRIDRIDRRSDGRLEVWDYKTGSPKNYDPSDLLANGTRFQWALYALAAEQIMGSASEPARVATSGYFFPTDRGHGERIAAAPPSVDALSAYLDPLLEMARDGCFPRIHRVPGQCSYCDFKRICNGEQSDAGEIYSDEETPQPIRDWCAGA